ncbi:MAG: hypothetical protein WKF87_15980 [Chryseolinea sp.]
MPSINKLYLIIGPGLIVCYALQYTFYPESQAFVTFQNDGTYKLVTGLLLLLLILTQWGLTFARVTKLTSAKCEMTLSFHKWSGAISPLLLFIHSIKIGNGYLAILTLTFITNLVLGFLSIGKSKPIHIRYFQTWVLLHSVFSVVVLVLTFFHIWVVVYFE